MAIPASVGAYRPDLGAGLTAHDPKNVRYNSVAYRSRHDPDYLIYVYNLSNRTFEDPTTGRGIIGRINLRAPGVTDEDSTAVTIEKMEGKKKVYMEEEGDTKWKLITTFPQPTLISKFDDDQEQIAYIETDGVRFVVDQIWPDNPTRSLDVKLPDDNRSPKSSGNNFAEKGIFFSLANPPLKSDIESAKRRMENYYTNLLDRAGALELSDEKQLSEELRGNPDYSYAAQYYGRTFKWNRKNVRTTECPNCGDQKPSNRLFHVTNGRLCVERTQEAWKAVIESGFGTYDTVPEELRWRKEKAKAD